ncbi:MAG TPA: PadR family transcriptional regulator [Ardenticatenaceae bacterium]|nr:PadR family transcriptional regulator [Ardenticatenaceae bacterium]
MPVRHAILGLLAQRPMHGYEIDSEFEQGLRRICHVNISQIYAYLKNLEDRGWVRYETVLQERNPAKKVYHLTEEGQAELMHWLSHPVEAERQIRDDFLTKLFFCQHLRPDALRDLIENQKRIFQRHLNEVLAAGQYPMDYFTRLLYESGLRHARVDLEWIEWVEEQLESYGDNHPTAALAGRTEATAWTD